MSALDAIGPWRGRCGLCGHPDARHRLADAIRGQYAAGELVPVIAEYFGVTVRAVVAVIRAQPRRRRERRGSA